MGACDGHPVYGPSPLGGSLKSGVPISRRVLGPGSHVLMCQGSILPALGSGVKGGGLMNSMECERTL